MLALAGVAQAAKMTKSLAISGMCDSDELQTCVEGILKIDVINVEDVFGSVEKVRSGLRQLKIQLAIDNQNKDEDIARYIMNMMSLERQLMKNQALLSILSSRLEQAKAQATLTGDDPASLYGIFADIYKTTVARLSPRIKVTGSQELLEQKNTQDKIRTVLLFGMRCAVLWRQVGGKRRQLLFNRRQCLAAIDERLL